MTYSPIEHEAIGLCIAFEALNDLVNHELIQLVEVEQYPGEFETRFSTSSHQQLFLVRLLDFVHEHGGQSLTGVRGSCLEVLKAACSNQFLDSSGAVASLDASVKELSEWLDHRTPFKLWLPSLDVEADLTVPRIEFVRISGNQSKHNISRLTGISGRISRALKEHGFAVPSEDVPLALEDFRQHLQDDYFVYYGTWLCELLNNLRWGIYDYLSPTFHRVYKKNPGEELAYEYEYPEGVVNEQPRRWFWQLMNHVRSKPYVERFSAAHYMKKDVIR